MNRNQILNTVLLSVLFGFLLLILVVWFTTSQRERARIVGRMKCDDRLAELRLEIAQKKPDEIQSLLSTKVWNCPSCNSDIVGYQLNPWTYSPEEGTYVVLYCRYGHSSSSASDAAASFPFLDSSGNIGVWAGTRDEFQQHLDILQSDRLYGLERIFTHHWPKPNTK